MASKRLPGSSEGTRQQSRRRGGADLDELDARIRRLEAKGPEVTSTRSRRPTSLRTKRSDRQKVFLVHGHDDAVRETVARYLERLGCTPVILQEQVNGGRTIIEKVEQHGDACFAVVLLTADDIGGVAGGGADTLQPRARQNAVLEFGFFVGQLGRGRVCVLHKGALELPSDMLGVVYVPLEGEWRLHLARELREADFQLNLDAIL